MNVNTSPGQLSRASAQVTPGYMSGFDNSFETEALPGALPGYHDIVIIFDLHGTARLGHEGASLQC